VSSVGTGRWQERVPDEAPADGDSSSAFRAAERVAHYDELIRFESRILDQMLALGGTLTADARDEVEESNIAPLRALIDELRRRRDSWAERLEPDRS
jgi:hypothetical protein